MTMRTPSQIIIDEATSWPGVSVADGSRGETSLRLGRREIGHLHGDRAAHFAFPREVAQRLRDEGRVGPHPAFPDKVAWAARGIADERDVSDVIALLRLNYERMAAKAAAAR